MEEIIHISHEDHPLKLIENWETIPGGGDDDWKQGAGCCDGCEEPISEGSVYGCIMCGYFLHKTCAQLQLPLHHDLHAMHPLIPNNSTSPFCSCDFCKRNINSKFHHYRCSPCNFDVCTKCAVTALANRDAAIALKEDAAIKLEHEGHPQHTLTLQSRRASFLCNACNNIDRDFFYQCDQCDFWIHNTCASLAHTVHLSHHHHHTLFLAYSLPENFYNFDYFCEFCKKQIRKSDWIYHCPNCRYFIHIKCFLNVDQFSTPRDGPAVEEKKNDQDILHFPMADAFTDPLKLLHFEKMTLCDDDTIETDHWSHNHPLILSVVPQGKNMPHIGCSDPIAVCYGCVRPLSLPYYSCKDGCSFTLHKYCAELPCTLKHQLHPDHPLDLVNIGSPNDYEYCGGCNSKCNTFVYKCETCKFHLDVNCAFLPNTIKHESHKHQLVQVPEIEDSCKACNSWPDGLGYSCKVCHFELDMYCAVNSPKSLAHRYCKGHQILLTYPPVEDHLEDFYCDICEEEMHPKFPLYHCQLCKNSFHLDCLSQPDKVANIWREGTVTVSYHKHSLTYVRRKKTPRYVCFGCNLDINGRLILECRTGTCPFRICFLCYERGIMEESDDDDDDDNDDVEEEEGEGEGEGDGDG